MKFALSLRGSLLLFSFLLGSASLADQVIFTEVMYHPSDAKPEFVEVLNLTSNRRDIAKWKISGGISYAFPDFNSGNTSAHFLKEYERIVLSSADEAATRAAYPSIPASVRIFGPWTGQLSNAGDTVTMKDAADALICTLSYGDKGKWPIAADGAGHSLVVINQDRAIDDWRNWKAGIIRGGSPGNAEILSSEEAVASPEVPTGGTTSVTEFNGMAGTGTSTNPTPLPANPGDTLWKYYNQATDPGLGWNLAGFNDSTWGGPGYAPLGFERNAGTAGFPGVRTEFPLTTSLVTYYFRTTFNWAGPTTGTSTVLDQFIDDGMLLYVNGQLVSTTRPPVGSSGHTAVANNGNAAPETTFETVALGTALDGILVPGVNTVAAEIHQNQTASSDLVFALRMKITTATRNGVVINEVRPGTVGNGFVEFYNPTAAAVELNGYYLSDSISNLTKFQISSSLIVPPSSFATVGFAESNLAMGTATQVYLTMPDGVTKQSALNGIIPTDGRSLGRKPSGGNSWYLFTSPTPGSANQSLNSFLTVQLNEVHFAANGHADWVEFSNAGSSAASGTGLFVSARSDFADKIPLPASIGPNAFASSLTDFIPDSDGSLTLYLIDASHNVLETAELNRIPALPSVQRFPIGSKDWFSTASATQDAANNPARHEEIVINEIMFKLPSGHDDGQYVELVNRSAGAVSLGGWRFSEGLSYDFPPGTSIGAGEYLVVAKNPAYFAAAHPGVTNVHGPFGGRLKGSGEWIKLEDAQRNVADSVDFKVGGQWPTADSGEGSSLELIHPDMDNSQPSSWRASNESGKSMFQNFSVTGPYMELRGANVAPTQPTLAEARELMLNLVGDGHVIVKNISLTRAGSGNLIPTGDATSHTGDGANGFRCTGTHATSDTLADGFHLISEGGGDTKANHAEVDVTGIAKNDVLTLSFDARWISGSPLLVAQTWDRSFGKVFRLPIPNHLGTPGAANTAAASIPAPTVDSVSHSPAVPRSTNPVVVTAKISSASGLASVELMERIDNIDASAAYASTAMNDAGINGDAIAGDGIFSGTVAARPDATITQFYVRATAANGAINECPRDGAARPGMWIVDNSPPDPTPNLLTHRYVLSRYHRDALDTQPATIAAGRGGTSAKFGYAYPRMSSKAFNSTIILNERDVLYNAEIRKGGSPWTRSTNAALDRVRWKPPGDQQFRNISKTGLDNDAAGAARFHNRLVRYWLYLLGYPVPDAEFVQEMVNEDSPRLCDQQEQTDSDFFDRAYENGSDGELFEIDDAWYMFDTFDGSGNEMRIDGGSVTARWSLLDWNNSTAAFPSAESPLFYHSNWPIRFPEDRYDFSSLATLIKTAYNGNVAINTQSVSTQSSWQEQMERMIDPRRAAMYAAVRGYAADWDNFTRDRGKNGYFYRRITDGKFEFHHWDSDLAFRASDYAVAVTGGAGGIGWTNFSRTASFRRLLNYYLNELISKYTTSPRFNAWLAANDYQSAVGNSLAPFKVNTIANPTYQAFIAGREPNIIADINKDPVSGAVDGTPTYSRAFSITTASGQTVASPFFAISGEAPASVWSVSAVNHPEAICTFTTRTTWTLSNLILANGLNNLTIRALAEDGTELFTLPFVITCTGNGSPIVAVTSNPASMRVAVNEIITLDATSSVDPEGGLLTYAWSVNPSTSATIGHSVPGKTEAKFQIPGVYAITVVVTDPSGMTNSLVREVTVTSANDFYSFSSTSGLDPALMLQNVKLRDEYAPSSWYSIEDFTGRLVLQVLDDSAKPLGNPTFAHPVIKRDLPDTSDFTLQTELEPDTREFGSFFTGLWLETTESGQAVKTVFGIDGGLNLTVSRAIGNGAFSAYYSATMTGSGAVLRIRRVGNQLQFQRRVLGAWIPAFSLAIPAGSIAGNGGIFLSTSAAINARVAFDYLLVADPANTSSVIGSLKISEIMYNPAGSGVEYIELRNYGTQAINLTGVNFASGKPFATFIFGNETLQPGEFICVTENIAAFRATHGNTARLGGAWASGNLNNIGEEIILNDADGNNIQQFTYGDSNIPGWPATPDGQGPSLEIIDENGNYNLGSNWRASGEVQGSPGYLGLGPDSDGDGIPDLVESRFGTNPNNASSTANTTSSMAANGQLTLTWPTVAGRSYRVERSTDLVVWNVISTKVATGSTASHPDLDTPAGQRFYYRIVALP